MGAADFFIKIGTLCPLAPTPACVSNPGHSRHCGPRLPVVSGAAGNCSHSEYHLGDSGRDPLLPLHARTVTSSVTINEPLNGGWSAYDRRLDHDVAEVFFDADSGFENPFNRCLIIRYTAG